MAGTNAAVLERQAVQVPSPSDSWAMGITRKASRLLRHGPFGVLVKIQEDRRTTLQRLVDLLNELGIEPFSPESVKRYQEAMLKSARVGRPYPTFIRWERTSIDEYRRSVPESVLAKATAIREEVPSARLLVEWLNEDPFLIVKVPGAEYYVEVWGEPEFQDLNW
ncbi:MAG: hypothetical protein Q7S63_03225 [bacterium]|nr:hypothetical protein [bacterium]